MLRKYLAIRYRLYDIAVDFELTDHAKNIS